MCSGFGSLVIHAPCLHVGNLAMDITWRAQVCRCAGLSSSDLVDACMHNRNPSGGDGGGGMSFGNTLFLLLVVAGIMGGVGYVHYKRTQAHMRDQVRFLLPTLGAARGQRRT